MPEEAMVVAVVAILSTFGIPGFVIWKHIEARNRERMAIIDKGMNAEDIRELFHQERRQQRNPNPLTSLKWGLLIFFVGIGLFVGIRYSGLVAYSNPNFQHTEDVIVPCVLISGGFALLLFYFIAAKKEKADRKEQTIAQSTSRD